MSMLVHQSVEFVSRPTRLLGTQDWRTLRISRGDLGAILAALPCFRRLRVVRRYPQPILHLAAQFVPHAINTDMPPSCICGGTCCHMTNVITFMGSAGEMRCMYF